eukprot:UN00624
MHQLHVQCGIYGMSLYNLFHAVFQYQNIPNTPNPHLFSKAANATSQRKSFLYVSVHMIFYPPPISTLLRTPKCNHIPIFMDTATALI